MDKTMLYLDMDGTIADFYGVEGWLSSLEKEDIAPYVEAKPLVKEEVLLLLEAQGYELSIVSWTSKTGSAHFNRAVRTAKKAWLKKYFPHIKFKECHIVAYGTPKHLVVNKKDSILVDDEEQNRRTWKGSAYSPEEFFK